MLLNHLEMRALEYVRNTNGGETKFHFMEDHEPIGPQLWEALRLMGLVTVDTENRIRLTEAGRQTLATP